MSKHLSSRATMMWQSFILLLNLQPGRTYRKNVATRSLTSLKSGANREPRAIVSLLRSLQFILWDCVAGPLPRTLDSPIQEQT